MLRILLILRELLPLLQLLIETIDRYAGDRSGEERGQIARAALENAISEVKMAAHAPADPPVT
jgi:hypothetical protein